MDEAFKVEIQLTDAYGVALELDRVLIDAVLYIQGCIRYRFYAGKTDERGRLRVTFDKLEKSRLANQSFSIMDYNTRLQECDSRISFAVLSVDDIKKRQAAAEAWFPEEVSQSEYFRENNNALLACETVDIDVDVNMSARRVLLLCERRG